MKVDTSGCRNAETTATTGTLEAEIGDLCFTKAVAMYGVHINTSCTSLTGF